MVVSVLSQFSSFNLIMFKFCSDYRETIIMLHLWICWLVCSYICYSVNILPEVFVGELASRYQLSFVWFKRVLHQSLVCGIVVCIPYQEVVLSSWNVLSVSCKIIFWRVLLQLYDKLMIVGILPCYTTNCSAFNHSKQITWTREREQQSSILSDTILFKIYNIYCKN